MNIDRSAPVLVTGGNGYIASWLVKYLLEDGIDVHATVRDPSNDDEGRPPEAAGGGRPRHPDPVRGRPAGRRRVRRGHGRVRAGVPHRVAVRALRHQGPAEGPGRPGRERHPQRARVSANRVRSVKRVVLTSSVVSIYGDAVDLKDADGDVFTEDDWNTTSSLTHQPYSFSKVEAETRRLGDRRRAGPLGPGRHQPGLRPRPVAHHRQRLGELRDDEAVRRRDDADGRTGPRARRRRRARRRPGPHQRGLHPRRQRAATSASAGR